MDQEKIGKFIADRRKRQGLTQKQLADQLSVTDKTISKWETGYRLPDASLLLELSSVLQVDLNELLTGEEFSSKEVSSEEYMKKSESNILGLVNEINEIDKKRRSKNVGTLVGSLLTGLAFLYLLAVSLRMGKASDFFDITTLLYLLGLKFLILSISGWAHDYLNAWKTLLPNCEATREEVELAIQAVRYAGALTLTLGCLLSFMGLFSLLNYMESPVSILSLGASFAQVALTLAYTAIGETIYVILAFRMKGLIR